MVCKVRHGGGTYIRMTSPSSSSEPSGWEVGVSWVEKMGGFQSDGSDGTMSFGRNASFIGGTGGLMKGMWVVERLVFMWMLERENPFFLLLLII